MVIGGTGERAAKGGRRRGEDGVGVEEEQIGFRLGTVNGGRSASCDSGK